MSEPIPVTIRLAHKFNEIIRLWNEGKTQKEIGEIIGEPRRTVLKICKHLDLKRTVKDAASIKNRSKLDDPEIVAKIKSLRDTCSLQEIVQKVGGSVTAVNRICKKYNISIDEKKFRDLQSGKMKSAWTPEKRAELSGSKYDQLNDEEWLRRKYVTESVSMSVIAEEVGTSVGIVAHHLERHGIKKRSKIENYSKLRRKNATKVVLDTKWGKFKLQSKQEAAFVQSLDENDQVEYEPEILEYKGCQYVPDFRVNGEFVEVKPPEYARYPGADRQKFARQLKIAQENNIRPKCWYKGRYFDYEPLGDLDKYFASDWRVFFDTPKECFDFLVDYDFIPLQWDKDHLLRGLDRLFKAEGEECLNANLKNEHVLNLIKHFSRHFWSSTHKGYNAIIDAFAPGNRVVLLRALERLWLKKNDINIYHLVKLIARHFKDFTTVSIFKPWVAAYIYDKYLPDGGMVVDPCMGWGGRLLGTVDRDISYRGYDLNNEVIISHRDLRKFLGSRLVREPEFVCADSGQCDFDEGDLLFTSPPYDDTEYYYGLENQCGDTTGILKNIFRSSINLIVLNIPKWYVPCCVEIGSNSGFILAERLDMRTASFMGREKTSEPILVFKRK